LCRQYIDYLISTKTYLKYKLLGVLHKYFIADLHIVFFANLILSNIVFTHLKLSKSKKKLESIVRDKKKKRQSQEKSNQNYQRMMSESIQSLSEYMRIFNLDFIY
jgi:hypothetical protein